MAAAVSQGFSREVARHNLERVSELPKHIQAVERAYLNAILKAIEERSSKAPISGGAVVLNRGRVCLGFVNKAKEDDPAHHTYSTMAGGGKPRDLQEGKSVFVELAKREASEETHGYFSPERLEALLLKPDTVVLENAGIKEGRWVGPLFVIQMSDEEADGLLDKLRGRARAAVERAAGQRVEVTDYAWIPLQHIFDKHAWVEGIYRDTYQGLRARSHLTDEEFQKQGPNNVALQHIYNTVVTVRSEEGMEARINAAARRTFGYCMEQLRRFM